MARDQYYHNHKSRKSIELREKRKYTRVTVNIPASLTILQLEAYHSGFLRNISRGGCLLSTSEKMPVGVECRLAITIGEGLETKFIAIPGRIVRSDGTALGIEFLEIDSQLDQQLQMLIRKHEGACQDIEKEKT